jgi:zinc transport system ATP-binding protein
VSTEPAITLEDVTFGYDGTPVLTNVNLTIQPRDFVCVLGPNGGGKTTLLKLMLGLIEPQRGTVRVLGRGPAAARSAIGYLPQHVQLDPQFPANVLDIVLMGRLGRRRAVGPYGRGDRAIARHALEEVDVANLRHRPLGSLSGGQRQRVLIARALACQPEVLLLDEPTANLDPAVQDDLYRLLDKLNERLTILIVSHDIGFVSVFFRSVVCVNRTVHTHAASELTDKRVTDLYGREVRVLHPDHAGDAGGRR